MTATDAARARIARLKELPRSAECPVCEAFGYQCCKYHRQLLGDALAMVALVEALLDERTSRQAQCGRVWLESEAKRVEAALARLGTVHRYISTYCHHGQHDVCASRGEQLNREQNRPDGARMTCKVCAAACGCSCHAVQPEEPVK